MKLLTGHSPAVARWVADRIDGAVLSDLWPCEAAGVLDAEGRMAAGVVYHGYRPSNGTIEMSVAADTPRWAMPDIIRDLLAYPFGQLGVTKAVAVIQTDNERSLRLVKGLGFEQEAILRRHIAGRDVAICSMFRETWLKRWSRGQQQIRAEAA